MFAKIQENIPVWGRAVEKVECANHVCKCLRSNLEPLVDNNPMYIGKTHLTKASRVRLTSTVRCNINTDSVT